MFSRILRGAEAPHVQHISDPAAPLRLDEARLTAWALALGQTRHSTDPPPSRRVHRGQLADVDFTNAVRVPRRRGPVGRLISRLVGSGSSDPDAGVSGDDAMSLGEADHRPYLAHASHGSSPPASAAAEPEPQSRAA